MLSFSVVLSLMCSASLHVSDAPQGELDELEREEFFRLKKVQKNKQKVLAMQDAENKARAEAQVRACGHVMLHCMHTCEHSLGGHCLASIRNCS